MNEHESGAADDTAFFEKMMRYQDGAMPEEEIAAFENEMRDDASKRRRFAEAQMRSIALRERFRQDAFRVAPKQENLAWFASFVSRPFNTAAAGLVLGLFCASLAWAVVSPRAVATMARVFALVDGGFEKAIGMVPSGFPKATGVWSGDDAEIVSGSPVKAAEGARMLRFIEPRADATTPDAPAIACDVFQLVDLRPLRSSLNVAGDSVLELSARFLDARPHNTNPSVTFFCQLYIFNGDPSALHQVWPLTNREALSSGSAQVTTLGSTTPEWQKLTARCLVPTNADFAVVQIAARPNLRPTKLESLYADDVTLTLKTQPAVPVRVVRR